MNFFLVNELQISSSRRGLWKSGFFLSFFFFLKKPLFLGKAVIKNFKDSWKTLSIDLRQNTDSHFNILLNENSDFTSSLPSIYQQISKISDKFDSIMCVAGGWCGGSIKSPEIFSQMEKMSKINLYTAVLSKKNLY